MSGVWIDVDQKLGRAGLIIVHAHCSPQPLNLTQGHTYTMQYAHMIFKTEQTFQPSSAKPIENS